MTYSIEYMVHQLILISAVFLFVLHRRRRSLLIMETTPLTTKSFTNLLKHFFTQHR